MSTSAAPTPTNTGTVASPTRVLTYEDFSYTGCYVEPAGGRVLSRNLGASNTMTVQTCLDLAKQEGLGYAGVEYGSEYVVVFLHRLPADTPDQMLGFSKPTGSKHCYRA